MTVKLLAPYGQQPAGSAFVGDGVTEAALVSAGLASNTLTGATSWPPTPDSGGAAQPWVSMLSLDTTGTSAATAAANAAAIQAAVRAQRLVRLVAPAASSAVAAYCNPFRLPLGAHLFIDAGLVLRRADNVNAPLIKGSNSGQQLPGTRFVRTGGSLVTVANRFHGLSAGRKVWVGAVTDTTMNGIVTVVSTPDAHTWTYAAAGSNGAGGASTNFAAVIPLNRVLAGANFSAASNIVTVDDPGHDLRPGMNVWLGTSGASTAFCGLVEVIAVYSGRYWQYVTAAAGTGTASGSIAVSYERDIVIDGNGAIDGNKSSNSAPTDLDLEASLMSFGMLNQSRIAIKQAGSTIFRVINMFSPADVVVEGVEYYDTLVGSEVEGSGMRNQFLRNRGGTALWNSGAQQIDDVIAFTGTKLIGGQLYDSSVSPYGLGNFLGNTVRELDAPTCLNGIKLTADTSCYIDNLNIDGVRGGLANFNITPFGGSSGVRFVDDGLGQIAMKCGRLYVKNVHWTGGQNAFQWSCSGSADLLDLNGIEYQIPAAQLAAGGSNVGFAINITGPAGVSGSRIKNLQIDNVVDAAKGASRSSIVLGSQNSTILETITIDNIHIGRNVDLTCGGGFSAGSSILKYANCTTVHVKIEASFRGPDSGTGHAITITGPNMGVWELDEIRVTDGVTALSHLFTFAAASNTAAMAGKLIIRGGSIKCISGIYDNATATTGTMTVVLQGADTSNISNNLFNQGSSTAAITLLADPASVVPADKVIGTSSTTLRVNGPSIKLDGNKVTIPAVGDQFWNTNASMTGSASVGMKGRTNAGAWTALF